MLRRPLILASGSPRRRQLLEEAGYQFEVLAPHEDVECGVCSQNGPAGLVTDLAFRKASAVRDQLSLPQPVILVAADTVAECDGFVLGKPRDEAHARAMLQQLRGRAHRVLTGICVWPLDRAEPLVRVAVTQLVMDALSDEAIDDYLATGEWRGKAGAFGYQDRLGWVHVEEGSESNVVGLPLELLEEMLREVGER
ncbi:MAG: nucleoside triphosphate pyrophosphatase [Pirellulales bacterium]